MNSRLKNLREMLNLTQADLAEDLGISRQSLISLERGKCKPSIDLAREIADFFEIPIELIFYPSSARRASAETSPIINKKGENMAKSTSARQSRCGLAATGRGRDGKEKKELAPWSGFSPFRELTRMHEEIDRMFDNSFMKDKGVSFSAPVVDVADNDKTVVVKADLPGVEEKDVEIEVHEDYVKIDGERKEDKEVKKENYCHRESSYGSFSRSIPLPAKVRPNRARAKMENGQLEIIMPKLKISEIKVKKLKPGE